MSKKLQPKKIKANKHWGSLAEGYLNLAEIGLKSYKDKVNIGKFTFSRLSKVKTRPVYFLKDGNTIIACIWNIKHGLELMLKGIGINLDKIYWEKHDLEFLLKDLEVKLQQYNIGKDLDDLRKLVDKYYYCRFSSKTKFHDFDNTYFKYPETMNGGILDYSFVHDLKRADINKFLKDIYDLQKLLSKIENAPTVSYLKNLTLQR